MQDPAEVAAPPAAPPAPETEAEALARRLGVDAAVGRALFAAGLSDPEAVRGAPDEQLQGAGLSVADIARLRAPSEPEAPSPRDPHAPVEESLTPEVPGPEVPAPEAPAVGTPVASAPSAAVEKWMRSVRHAGHPRRRVHGSSPAKGSTEVLRKWVDGDDRALETWIQSSEGVRPPPAGAPPPAPVGERRASTSASAGATGAPMGALPANLVEREETVVRWLTELLDRVKTDQFDPNSILQEFQELQRGLYDEREKRRQLEDQLEHVKRGSIAVIKYVRAREASAREELLAEKDGEVSDLKARLDALVARVTNVKGSPDSPPASAAETVRPELETRIKAALAEKEVAFAEREAEYRRRIVELEGELRTVRSDVDNRRSSEGSPSASSSATPQEYEERERELLRRENELRSRFEEIRIRSEELERKREGLNFKDHEVGEREQDVTLRQQALEVEFRRLEEAKRALPVMAAEAGASPQVRAEADRLVALEEEIHRRQKELEERESFLTRKIAEVEDLQKKAVAQEADRMHIEATVDTPTTKIRTGVRRLDDLLFGGVPVGSQLLINGPAHSGKDVLSRLFIAEGLRSGHGALWVITDRTYTTVRDEMTVFVPNYAEYEKKGMVRYVDLYSRSLGVSEADRGVKLLASNDKALLEQLNAAVNAFAGELKDKSSSYRLVFESVSTVTAYLDSTAMFRFLQPLIGRRKMDGAAGYYELETGMHSDSDLQTLEHMMDGSVNLKVDQLKTFLSVRGITDVQSRAWVGYTFTKRTFNLGSFSLDHIR
jgi:KaiC/GvpD/RAD55 family RecA-like ATPase